MSILEVLTIPDKRLRIVAQEVSDDQDLSVLVDDMLETMYHENGIGLAAPQVGVSKRVIVIDCRIAGEQESVKYGVEFPLVMINPVFIYQSDELVEYDEGCLSVPDESILVSRPKRIVVKYRTLSGNNKEIDDDGWLARVIQHECDHLNGKVIVDYLSKLKKDMLITRLVKKKSHKD